MSAPPNSTVERLLLKSLRVRKGSAKGSSAAIQRSRKRSFVDTKLQQPVNGSKGRAPVRHQISVTGSLMISKPPLPMINSSGGFGSEADLNVKTLLLLLPVK
ncbi:MAG: hypothetical protein ABTQ25_11590, partial [Nitrosomonas ureae]